MSATTEPEGWRSAAPVAAAALLCLSTIPPMATASPTDIPRGRDMIVPLAQVQSIVGAPTLDAHPGEDRTSPRVDHSMDAQLSAPCRHFINQDEVFGSTWSNFASAGYGGPSNLGVQQSIAAYLDNDAAQRTFDALKTAARQCHKHPSPDAFGAGTTLTEPDAATLQVQYSDTVNGPGSVTLYALRGQVLIEVGASHLSTDPRIAQTVLTLISKNIT